MTANIVLFAISTMSIARQLNILYNFCTLQAKYF